MLTFFCASVTYLCRRGGGRLCLKSIGCKFSSVCTGAFSPQQCFGRHCLGTYMNWLRFLLAGRCLFVHFCSDHDNAAVGSHRHWGQTLPCLDDIFFVCKHTPVYMCFFCRACQGPVLHFFYYFGAESKTAGKAKHQHTYGFFFGSGRQVFVHAGFEKLAGFSP